MDLSQLKSNLISIIKSHYSSAHILSAYPITKQLDLSNGVIDDPTALATMKAFITGKIDDIALIETDINDLADTEMYDNFIVDSNANMMSYVLGYLPNLTTDEQKLSVAIAIQSIR